MAKVLFSLQGPFEKLTYLMKLRNHLFEKHGEKLICLQLAAKKLCTHRQDTNI